MYYDPQKPQKWQIVTIIHVLHINTISFVCLRSDEAHCHNYETLSVEILLAYNSKITQNVDANDAILQ